MPESVLDTDMLSEVIKRRNVVVAGHASRYVHVHGQIAFSAFTRFEIVRGLMLSGATGQLAKYAALCRHSLILPITDSILDRAADLWVIGRRGGHPTGDADLLIAATAIEHHRTLVTGNTGHFSWIAGLSLEDWRQP